MGRMPKGHNKNSVNEEESVTNSRRRSRLKSKKDEVTSSSKSGKQKHQRIRSLPISIQKSLIKIRECESQRPSPTPENDIFYQQNSSRPSVLRFKNQNFQVVMLHMDTIICIDFPNSFQQ